MRTLVVGAVPRAGAQEFYVRQSAAADLIVAADAAGEWLLDAGVEPDVVVGDFDSAAPGAPERLARAGVRVVRVSERKDETDLELAVAEARALGTETLAITAAFDARLDHTLAAFGALARAADLSAELVEPDLTGWALDSASRGALELSLDPGTLVSFLAPLGPARGVTLEGFEYPLLDAVLEGLAGRGVSNVVSAVPARVTVGSGSLLALVPHAARP